MNPRVNIHATAVTLGTAAAPFGGPTDAAVLIFGPPGSGKSDLALRLIAAGALLVADDRTLLTTVEDRLFAEAPEPTRGQIEVRGTGIITVPYVLRAEVALAVQLFTGSPARLPEETRYEPPAPLLAPRRFVPLIKLHAFEASSAAKIAAAASAAAAERFVAGVAPGKTS